MSPARTLEHLLDLACAKIAADVRIRVAFPAALVFAWTFCVFAVLP